MVNASLSKGFHGVYVERYFHLFSQYDGASLVLCSIYFVELSSMVSSVLNLAGHCLYGRQVSLRITIALLEVICSRVNLLD
jgi:hypothetical protein